MSVLGDEDAKQKALEGLRSAAGFLRTRVAKALTTRTVPELHFELDRGLEHAARINELLASLEARRSSRLTGALLVDKPAGITSHDVVARARRVLGERSIGHTGTLDPFATGLLVLLVGTGDPAGAVPRRAGARPTWRRLGSGRGPTRTT